MAIRRGRGRRPPPQQTARALSNDSEDDEDDIVALDHAPAHLRAVTPQAPIIVLSDSDSDTDIDATPVGHSSVTQRTPARYGASRAMKRRWSSSSEESPFAKRTRYPDPVSPHAGPSQAPSTPPVEPILPKAEYLVPSVLEVIPDLCPVWAAQQLEALIKELSTTSNVPGQHAVQRTIEMAFEMEVYPTPQAEKEPEEEGDYSEVTYRNEHRKGLEYGSRAIDFLQDIFATVPLPHIRDVFATEGQKLLVPTYQVLHKQSTSADKPYQELKRRRYKGKQKAEAPPADPLENESASSGSVINRNGITEFYAEHAFLQELMPAQKELEQVSQQKADEEEQKRKEAAKQAAIERGDAVECGCCFDQEAPDESVACPEGHLFCKECLRAQVETKLGDQQVVIKCMDMSGCTAEYTEKIIAAAVSAKTMSLYQRLRQLKDLEMAAIEGLETCPFCPFAIVIDNEHEKLFRCQNDECKKVTCRSCKRPDHIPKRCEEVEADLKLNSRHAVEEAMSEALVRKCPHCSKPYIKTDGCNKMTCTACGKMSCFVCRKAITNYEHFDGHGPRRSAAKCPLYDANEARTEAERVRLARDEAQRRVLEDAEASGVAVEEQDLDVDVPEVPPQRFLPPHLARMRPGLGFADLAPRMLRQGEDFRNALLRGGAEGAGGADLPNIPGVPPYLLPHIQAARQQRDLDAEELRQELINIRRHVHAHRPAPPAVAGLVDYQRPAAVARGRRAAPAPAPLPPPPPPQQIRRGEFQARLEAWRHDVDNQNYPEPPPMGAMPPFPPFPRYDWRGRWRDA